MRIVICDDDTKYLDEIKEFCKSNVSEALEIYAYNDSKKMMNDLRINLRNIDLLILDIEMPGMTGIDIKNELSRTVSNTSIIFLTDHEELMQNAFGRNVIAFIKKNQWQEQLLSVLRKVSEECEEVIVEADNKLICKKKIVLISSANYYSRICYLNDNSNGEQTSYFLIKKTLKEWEKQLPQDKFLRLSRFVLLNMENIKTFNQDTILMINNDVYRIPKGKIKEVRNKYFSYCTKYRNIL